MTNLPLFNSNQPLNPNHKAKTQSVIKSSFLIHNDSSSKNLFKHIKTSSDFRLLFLKFSRALFITDLLMAILNILIIILMFIDYHKLKDNHYILTKANTTYRIICLCFTTMIISMLVFRYILKSKCQYIKYVLGVWLSYP